MSAPDKNMKQITFTAIDAAIDLVDHVDDDGLEDLCEKHATAQPELIDYILLSTTIQAGVGISDIHPISLYGKIAMITQQLILICTHVFTIYIFNI